MKTQTLELVLQEGEGLKVEFKERLAQLDREIVAFANTSGGTIYLGVNDNNRIIGIDINNALKSQVGDIARNCDPSIGLTFKEYHNENVLAVIVTEGQNKPYRCKDGFFIRLGASAQKLRRDEIVELVLQNSKYHFDTMIDSSFTYPLDFSKEAFQEYLQVCGIHTKASTTDILISLNAAIMQENLLKFTEAGVLFFAKSPQKYIRESFITCVKYRTHDRFSIIDKKDFEGPLIGQIENAIQFIMRHMNVEYAMPKGSEAYAGKRQEKYDYPPIAIREAVINAVTHRNYQFDATHTYIHLFPEYMDIENPGGLLPSLKMDDLGRRSVRRNPLIADFLHRAGYIERVGSGFDRMRYALLENNNPPLEVSATNFFSLRFYRRIEDPKIMELTDRQRQLYTAFKERERLNKMICAKILNVSDDTALREIQSLVNASLVEKKGSGRATYYVIKK